MGLQRTRAMGLMTAGTSESEALLQIFEVELLLDGTFEVVELAVGTFEQAGIVEAELMQLFQHRSKGGGVKCKRKPA